MRNQIRTIFNSATCELSILLIIGSMIVTKLSMDHHNGWNDLAVVASSIGGVVLVFIIGWITVKLITKAEVDEMPIKSRLVIESISRLLFLYWILITFNLIPALIWGVLILWDGIRSVKQVSNKATLS